MGRAAALGGYRVGAPLPSSTCGSPAAIPRWRSRWRGWRGGVRSRRRRSPGWRRSARTPAIRRPGSMRAPWRPLSCCAGRVMATSRRWVRCSRSRPTGRAGRHARVGSGVDRSGGHIPLAGRWPAGRAARAERSASWAWAGTSQVPLRVSGAAPRSRPMVLGVVAVRPGTAAVLAGRRRIAHGAARRRDRRLVDPVSPLDPVSPRPYRRWSSGRTAAQRRRRCVVD